MALSAMTAAESAGMMRDAADGRFPDADFSLRVAPLCGPAAAVIAFTGMFVVSGPVTAAWVEARMDGIASPLHPRLLLDLANPGITGLNAEHHCDAARSCVTSMSDPHVRTGGRRRSARAERGSAGHPANACGR